MHDAIGGGSEEGNAKVEPGGQHHAALIHNAGWSLPDGHLKHICTQRTLSAHLQPCIASGLQLDGMASIG